MFSCFYLPAAAAAVYSEAHKMNKKLKAVPMTDMLALLLFGLSWILIRQIKQIESVNQPVSRLDFCYGNILNETIFRQLTRPESTGFCISQVYATFQQ